MKNPLLLKLFILMACLMPSLSAVAAEAYACYTSSNTTLTFYYDNYRSSRTGTTYDLNTGDNSPGWYGDETSYNNNITRVVFNSSFANARPTTTYLWFFEAANLTSITGLNYLNTSEVTNMGAMFQGCRSLTNLDLSSFNTAKVTDMRSMFNECSGLTSLNLSGFKTYNVTDTGWMFDSCTGLTSLDLSSFHTSSVTNMGWMFAFCTGLTSLDLNNFDTSNVKNMAGMFAFCTGLTSLGVNHFNTHNVEDMNAMFGLCSSLTSLDLGNFNTEQVTNMQNMFNSCSNLTTILASNKWNTANVTESENMFVNCPNLVGGMGTAYDANHVDATYAHIDDGPSYPGYFTLFIIGDVNADGAVNIADVTAMIDFLLSEAIAPGTADCNQDGEVNIADVTVLIDFLLSTPPDYYIVGNDPFGGWDPAAGVKMTRNADGSYSYTATIDGSVWFVFASGLSSDWEVLNSDYRFGPAGFHDETIVANTWVNTQRQYNGMGAYKFTGTGYQYVFTFIPSAGISPTTGKFMIDGAVVIPPIDTYTVAGVPTSVFGTEWDAYNTSNDMTLNSNGVYELIKNNCLLNAGSTVEWKVVGNHDWGNAWPQDNCSLNIDTTGYYNLKFTFDPNTYSCSVQIL